MTSSTTSAYHIPVNNERSNRIMNSSTRNTPRMIMSDTTTTPPPPSNNNNSNNNNNLVNTVMNDSSMRVGTPGSSGYGSGNELTTGNSTQSTSPIGSTPRIFGNCAECSLRIVNLTDACYAMGYLYHNSCFVCCCCKRTLRGKVFYKDQDKIYCEEDYLYCGFQQTVEKCFACGHIIAETILLAMGNTYHPGCFRCCICTKCLDGIPFTVDSRNLIYCLPDYHLVYGPLCAVCGLVITPEEGSDEVRRVVALGKEFHIDCYRCIDCKRCLSDEPEKRCYPFNEPDPGAPGRSVQRMLCLNCHLQRIGAIPATSAGGIVNSNNNSSSSNTTNNAISSISSGHTKSTSGILNYSASNNHHMNNSGGRYSTMPNRVQGSKLNTLNTSTVSPPSSTPSSSHHHHHHYPHHQQPYQLNTSLTTSTYQTTPHIHSAHSTSNSLGVKPRSTNGNNITNNTNNYAINWERARMNGANNAANHLHHGESSRSYHNSFETKS